MLLLVGISQEHGGHGEMAAVIDDAYRYKDGVMVARGVL